MPVIKKAKLRIQSSVERDLRRQGRPGDMFWLKNVNDAWSDKVEHTGPGGQPLANIQVSFVAPGELPEAPKRIEYDAEGEATENEG